MRGKNYLWAFVIACGAMAIRGGAWVWPQSASSTRQVEPVNALQSDGVKTGPYYALVIGNNHYQYLRDLTTAIKDANAVAEALSGNYGFETKILRDASRNDILSVLAEYRRTLLPDSNLLIYYAGHGAHDTDTEEAYWLPVDARADNNANWISADDITSNIRAIPSMHIVIVSDSCYSGAIRDAAMRSVPLSMKPVDIDRAFAKILKDKSRTILSSGGDEPVTDIGGEGHSIFAQAFLDGLRLMDEDRFTANELYETYVKRKVAGRSDQDPHYFPLARSGDDGGDFVFARVSAGTPPGSVASGTASRSAAVVPATEVPRAPATKTTAKPHEIRSGATDFNTQQRLAAAGEAKAMYALAEAYDKGRGTPRNYPEAVRWYRKAADAGETRADAAMGELYATAPAGYGVAKDYALAERYSRKAAESGNSKAMNTLGYLYENGYGVPLNEATAREWYQRGADAGDAQAMWNLGDFYFKGREYDQAMPWIQKSAEAGYPQAMYGLGLQYEDGRYLPKGGGTESVRWSQAMQWFQKAADAGDGIALYHLGVVYEQGRLGVSSNKAEAVRWYREAADAGYAIAMFEMANRYYSGNGVPQSYADAAQWYRRAADSGVLDAVKKLTLMYERGEGVDPSSTAALAWYKHAAELGDEEAAQQVKQLQ